MTAILGAWPVSGVNNVSVEDQAQNNYFIQFYRPFSKEISNTKWEGCTKWGGWKRSGTLDYIEEPVATICRKCLDNKIENENTTEYQFQG